MTDKNTIISKEALEQFPVLMFKRIYRKGRDYHSSILCATVHNEQDLARLKESGYVQRDSERMIIAFAVFSDEISTREFSGG